MVPTLLLEGNLLDSMHKQKPVDGKTPYYDKSYNRSIHRSLKRQKQFPYYLLDFHTSRTCPSKTLTSELGISQAVGGELGAISIGSGPIKHIGKLLDNPHEMEM